MQACINKLQNSLVGTNHNLGVYTIEHLKINYYNQEILLMKLADIYQTGTRIIVRSFDSDRIIISNILQIIKNSGFDVYQMSPTELAINLEIKSVEDKLKLVKILEDKKEETKIQIRLLRKKARKNIK